MTAAQEARQGQGDELYERFGKPLEAEHMGEYVAIFPDGVVVIGSTPREVAQRAVETVGRGSYLFCIGRRWVWKLR
jgi:hypothetical protein